MRLSERLYAALLTACKGNHDAAFAVCENGRNTLEANGFAASDRAWRIAALVRRAERNEERRDWRDAMAAREAEDDGEDLRDEQDSVYFNGLGLNGGRL